MEIAQIRYFLALCRERNFTRAAKHCQISQPSLTNAVQRLEHAVGGALFQRSPRGTLLTELGELVRPYFEQIDECIHCAHRDAACFIQNAKGRKRTITTTRHAANRWRQRSS